jgi:hypothetical protein
MSLPLTVVSGFWTIKSKHNESLFKSWFWTTLRINCPYIIFGNKEGLELVKPYRNEFSTEIRELPIENFYTYKFKDTIAIHEKHVPSKELNMIWNEKLFLMQKASQENPFNSEWFIWVDAGICLYRDKVPPQTPLGNSKKLLDLPKNKIIFTSSEKPYFNQKDFEKNKYYHFVSGTYMIHKSFIDEFIEEFKEACQKYLTLSEWYHTDQVILTKIYKEKPELFHQVGHGYGALLTFLFS